MIAAPHFFGYLLKREIIIVPVTVRTLKSQKSRPMIRFYKVSLIKNAFDRAEISQTNTDSSV